MTAPSPPPRRSKLRAIVIFCTALIALYAVLWGGATILAPRVLNRAIPLVRAQAERLGVGLSEISFANVRIAPSLNRISLQSPQARFDLDLRDQVRLASRMKMREFEVHLRRPLALRGGVRAYGLEVHLDESDLSDRVPFYGFINGELEIMDLPLAQPREVIREIEEALEELFVENKIVGQAQFSGKVRMKVEGREILVGLYTERKGNGFRLRFREEDVQDVADEMDLDLAPEQVGIVSLYPLRMPTVMEITDRARDLARKHEPPDKWLEDAHRHITWSFLLTKEFGEEFASLVTDAQEMRPGNSPDERAMDFHNNAMGRKLFAEGVPVSALAQRVREDPEIIRHPDEVPSFGGERLLR